jgi:hypothetical protein
MLASTPILCIWSAWPTLRRFTLSLSSVEVIKGGSVFMYHPAALPPIECWT